MHVHVHVLLLGQRVHSYFRLSVMNIRIHIRYSYSASSNFQPANAVKFDIPRELHKRIQKAIDMRCLPGTDDQRAVSREGGGEGRAG